MLTATYKQAITFVLLLRVRIEGWLSSRCLTILWEKIEKKISAVEWCDFLGIENLKGWRRYEDNIKINFQEIELLGVNFNEQISICSLVSFDSGYNEAPRFYCYVSVYNCLGNMLAG